MAKAKEGVVFGGKPITVQVLESALNVSADQIYHDISRGNLTRDNEENVLLYCCYKSPATPAFKGKLTKAIAMREMAVDYDFPDAPNLYLSNPVLAQVIEMTLQSTDARFAKIKRAFTGDITALEVTGSLKSTRNKVKEKRRKAQADASGK